MPFLYSRGPGSRPRASSASERRRRDLLRRIIVAVCCGCAVWMALQCVMATVATRYVAVAAKDIARGDVIVTGDVSMREVPDSPALDDAVDDVDAAAGMIAQSSIASGTPVFHAMLARRPTVGPGRTSMTIALSSSPDELIVGDTVRLVTASDDDGEYRVLAERATVLDVPEHANDDGLLSGAVGDQSAAVTFALPPRDALAVLQVGEHAPVLAVDADDVDGGK
ncbi:hypothetical protein GFD17_06400 [Bifidobacterium sp. SMB2]|uniref:SAF domain-containing protein n=1 Tax=Bifidobacterium saimiriisciurei TaxID=2661627 RepID=A0ABX0C8S0_9BIFI|nr:MULTISPECIES: SAF domain-containing protein [Bifidobacterium]NEG96388.1 hypothetical protein [Bifidobacterium sp. SMB2]NEH10980.1 hypothetical protein [Bifidobacterium saimiriisciurei]